MTLIERISQVVGEAFEVLGYDTKYAKVTISNRPDLCEYQCSGAMAAKKEYNKAPIKIAEEVAKELSKSTCFEMVEAVMPGFINIILAPSFVADYLNSCAKDETMGVEKVAFPETIILDFGGPNVAKPLHVGHLRSAIIGESIKRILRFAGHKVIGDIHLGDWGYQMGLIITEVGKEQPDLPYFDENYALDYPIEPPFTVGDLEEIYPRASMKAKEDIAYREEALQATVLLQNGHRGYRALWKHIMEVSVTDLKKNYEALDVSFDLWKGEADADPYIPEMVKYLKEEGYAYYDNGALIVDVHEETDKKEIPPCMILKSDGGALYDTTDLATLVEREKLFSPNRVIYVVDKRQDLHFVQVFRCAKKARLVRPETDLTFIGFGTMNGSDGKPFKTRDGGIMRLEYLLRDISDTMYDKISGNDKIPEKEARETAKIVGLSAIKYGDLSNQASKDYIFDLERFTSFEGNSGPYILYTTVRIGSIIKRYEEEGNTLSAQALTAASHPLVKSLMLEAAKFPGVMQTVVSELAPHKLCAYVFDLANAVNRVYNEIKILGEPSKETKEQYILLLKQTKDILTTAIDLLGITVPERM